eukprot:480472-Hanusia_phi.AAC.1
MAAAACGIARIESYYLKLYQHASKSVEKELKKPKMGIQRSLGWLKSSLSNLLLDRLQDLYGSLLSTIDDSSRRIILVTSDVEWKHPLCFVVDSFAIANLLDKHHRAAASFDMVNFVIKTLYCIPDIRLLQPDHALSRPCHSLGPYQLHIVSFAALACIGRWRKHHYAIKCWAVEARRICLERLHKEDGEGGAVNTEGIRPAARPFRFGKEGVQLQTDKQNLFEEAESIIVACHVVVAKLRELLSNSAECFRPFDELELQLEEPLLSEDIDIRASMIFAAIAPEQVLQELEALLTEINSFAADVGM